MLRIAFVLSLCLMAAPALAGQSSASFSVGVTIAKKGKPPKSVAARKATYTWGAASISVSRAGYRHIRRLQQSAGLYWFAARRGQGLYRVAVSATTGVIKKVIPT